MFLIIPENLIIITVKIFVKMEKRIQKFKQNTKKKHAHSFDSLVKTTKKVYLTINKPNLTRQLNMPRYR